jgi:hypothetical protein
MGQLSELKSSGSWFDFQQSIALPTWNYFRHKHFQSLFENFPKKNVGDV